MLWTGSAATGFLIIKMSCVGLVPPDSIAAIKLVDEESAHRTHLRLLKPDWQACTALRELLDLRSQSDPAMVVRYSSIELSTSSKTSPSHDLFSVLSSLCCPFD